MRWGVAELAAPVSPAILDDLAGVVVVIEGLDVDLSWVASAPFPVVAVSQSDDEAPDAVDVVVRDEAELQELVTAVTTQPVASMVLIDVLRAGESLDVDAAVVLESVAYSTLLASTDHARWLRSQAARSPKRHARPPVRIDRQGAILEVALQRPEDRNAISAAMRDALWEALHLPAMDTTIRTVRISADGPCFSSGGDLSEFGAGHDPGASHRVRLRRSVGRAIHAVADRVEFRVHGRCVGAGVELPAFAGRVVADPGATFRLPELAMGAIPGAGGTVSLPRRIGRRATARLALLGLELGATEALELGLVDEIEPVAD